jgi:hypothetical protein
MSAMLCRTQCTQHSKRRAQYSYRSSLGLASTFWRLGKSKRAVHRSTLGRCAGTNGKTAVLLASGDASIRGILLADLASVITASRSLPRCARNVGVNTSLCFFYETSTELGASTRARARCFLASLFGRYAILHENHGCASGGPLVAGVMRACNASPAPVAITIPLSFILQLRRCRKRSPKRAVLIIGPLSIIEYEDSQTGTRLRRFW